MTTETTVRKSFGNSLNSNMYGTQFWLLICVILTGIYLVCWSIRVLCFSEENEFFYDNRDYVRRLHRLPSCTDREGNVFTISDERNNAHRYPEFFYIEPSSEDNARVRSQPEKDDKDLPSYEEVMRMTTLASLELAAANGTNTLSIPAPPYTESIESPPVVVAALPAAATTATTPANANEGASQHIEPSTSGAAVISIESTLRVLPNAISTSSV